MSTGETSPPLQAANVFSDERTRVVLLASGSGTNVRALLDAQRRDDFGARIVALVTDLPGTGAERHAHNHGVPVTVVNFRDYTERVAWDRALREAVSQYHPDFVVSAGFMRILAPTFVQAFPHRILNTHPALLPAFPGAHGVRDALAYGVKVTGCTLHVVDEGTDTGPIIAQVAVPVNSDDTVETLHERIKVQEREMLTRWVSDIGHRGLVVTGRHVGLGANGSGV